MLALRGYQDKGCGFRAQEETRANVIPALYIQNVEIERARSAQWVSHPPQSVSTQHAIDFRISTHSSKSTRRIRPETIPSAEKKPALSKSHLKVSTVQGSTSHAMAQLEKSRWSARIPPKHVS